MSDIPVLKFNTISQEKLRISFEFDYKSFCRYNNSEV